MVLIKSSVVSASNYLTVLNEDSKQPPDDKTIKDFHYFKVELPISDNIIALLTDLFDDNTLFDSFHNFESLPSLFEAASFLQMPLMTELLVQLLNKLCQYDDPNLVPLQGSINVYWLGDHSKLKAATKVWLGLLTLPLKQEDEDDSCFSSKKLLKGKQISEQIAEKVILHTTDDLVCIELLESFIEILRPKLCCITARCGRLELLQYARSKNCPWTYALVYAAEFGHLEMIQWVLANGCPWDMLTGPNAARGGHLHILKYFSENERPFRDDWTCAFAAEGGNLNVLKWLRENDCPWNALSCDMAAEYGHLEVLQWLRSQEPPCPWHYVTFAEAAGNGNLEILKWLRANGCPWNETACEYASKKGNLEALKWLRENGCPWDQFTCYWAKHFGHSEVLNWALSNGCPPDDDEEVCCTRIVTYF